MSVIHEVAPQLPCSPFMGLKVLVVEDESLVSMLLEDMLMELGCRVVGQANSVRQALAGVSEHRLDAVVLDVNLHGEMVYPVAERLEAEGIPFLFVTGYGRIGVPDRWRRWPVIQKPFQLATLAAALHEVLGDRSPEVRGVRA